MEQERKALALEETKKSETEPEENFDKNQSAIVSEFIQEKKVDAFKILLQKSSHQTEPDWFFHACLYGHKNQLKVIL